MPDARLALFVFIDSLGWEIVRQESFLDAELPERRPVESVFGYSSTCVPTILTGRSPREHGHFSSFFYAPESSPFRVCRMLDWLPSWLTRRGRVRRMLSAMIARWHGFTGYFQLYQLPFSLLPYFDYAEKRDLLTSGSILGGQPTVFDRLAELEIPFVTTDWRSSEEVNLERIAGALQEGRSRVAYLYLPGLDAVLHEYGPSAREVTAKLRWYEEQLRVLLGTARRCYGEVRTHVFSDHGQAAVHQEVDLMSRLKGSGLEFGRDYAVVWDATMARFWFLRPHAEEQVRTCLGDDLPGCWVESSRLQSWGCDFPNGRYGDAFFLLDAGVVVHPSFMGGRPAGMHGYAPEHPSATACLLSSRVLDAPPSRLADLYGLMLAEARWASV